MNDTTPTFRQQVRELLAADDIRAEARKRRSDPGRDPDDRPLYRALGRHGLLAPDWPVEYGGRGLGPAEATALYEELVLAGLPDTLHVNTVQIVGRFLLMAGTDQQKAAHLPAFAAGERFASVLYTEPQAGSDLASLSTTAVADGDGYRIDGVKVFSLKSDRTDLGLCAARTGDADSRYRGISLFLVDLAAEGVHRTVIPSIADEQFHRVELRGVRVPAEALIGTENEGWPLLTQALAVERTGLDYALKAERWYRAVLRLRRDRPEETARHGAGVDAARLFAARLTQHGEDGREGEQHGAVDEPLSAAAKYYTSELAQAVAEWAARLGAGQAPDPRQDLEPTDVLTADQEASAVLEAAYREAPGLTLSAGTSEVMLQVVAGAGSLDPGDDLLQRQLRQALRKRLAQATTDSGPGVHDAPAPTDAGCPSWTALVDLGAPLFEVPVEAGGLDLGLGAATVVAEELGRAALRGPYLDTALLLDMPDPRAAGFIDTLSAGRSPVLPSSPPPDPPPGPVRDRQRLRQSAYLLGLAGGACHEAVLTSRERVQFGRPLADWQAVSHPLARLLVRIEAARLLLRRAAELCDGQAAAAATGTPQAVAVAEALALSAETALEAVRTAVHTCGVRGMTDATVLHRHYRLVRTEAVRLGAPADLWLEAGLLRLAAQEQS